MRSLRFLAVPALVLALMLPGGANAQSSMACAALSYNLYFGLSDAQTAGEVSRLQARLGGQVTGYFGPLTEQLVQRWQAAQGIVSSGSADATGYGAVGPRSRALMATNCNLLGSSSPSPSVTSSSSASTTPTNDEGEQLLYAEYVASAVDLTRVDGGGDYVEYEIVIDLTANDSDIYLSISKITEDASLSSVAAQSGWNIDVTGTTIASNSAYYLTSTAEEASPGVFIIEEGDTEEFTVKVAATSVVSGSQLKLGAIQFGTSASNVFAKTLYLDTNEFDTASLKSAAASCKIWTNKDTVASGEKYTISWTTEGIVDPWMNQIAKAGGYVRTEKKGSMSWQAPTASGTASYEEFKIGEGEGGSINNALCTTVVKILPLPETEPKVSFTGVPPIIKQGQNATLTWTSKNANRCLMQYGSTEEKIGLSGTKTVSPSQTTKYALSCTNDPGTGKDGPTAFANTTISVLPATTTPISMSVTIPKSTHTTENPTLTGTAKGVTSFTLIVTGTAEEYAVGVSVKNGKWSHKVSTDLPNGTYGVEAHDPKWGLIGSGTFRVEVPEEEPAAYESVVAVGVYEGSYSASNPRVFQGHTEGTVNVNVTGDNGKSRALVLSSYEPVNWVLNVQNGVEIPNIIVTGYHKSRVTNVPSGTNVSYQSYEAGGKYFYAYQASGDSYTKFYNWLKVLYPDANGELHGNFVFPGYSASSVDVYLGWKG